MIREDYTYNDTKKSACHHLADDEDFVRRLVQETLNEVLESEMTEFLGAGKSERTKTRQGYRSGYYRRDLTMKVGEIELRVPQERSGQFSTRVFERYQRSEKALVAVLSEMYVQGVSTRRVSRLAEDLCGHEFSPATSRVRSWRRRLRNWWRIRAVGDVCAGGLDASGEPTGGRSVRSRVFTGDDLGHGVEAGRVAEGVCGTSAGGGVSVCAAGCPV